MNQLPVFFGAVAYEFRMQIRRRAVWITMILLILLVIMALRGSTGGYNTFLGINELPLSIVIANWTDVINAILPIGVGVLLADRLPRDRRMRVDELFTSMPGALSSRLLGKYMGSMLATLVPMFAFYCIGIGYIFSQVQQPQVLLLAVETFAAIVLPGILFISAFSIACPAILWVPLYQFLFVGYWFWGNWLGARTGIPTLSDTILTPAGTYISAGFFGDSIFPVQNATVWLGIESMLLILSIAVFVMVVLWSYLKWQQARQ